MASPLTAAPNRELTCLLVHASPTEGAQNTAGTSKSVLKLFPVGLELRDICVEGLRRERGVGLVGVATGVLGARWLLSVGGSSLLCAFLWVFREGSSRP